MLRSMKHLPGFVAGAAEMRGRGVDTVACVSVNDAFVMDAWAKSLQNSGRVLMLADGGGAFTHEMGVELDLSGKGVGIRSRRYSLIADDRVVRCCFRQAPVCRMIVHSESCTGDSPDIGSNCGPCLIRCTSR